MSVEQVELGELMVRRGGSINPAKHPDEVFELFSIPAHDAGRPEVVCGSAIGSTKQIVEPGDVMISKIVPHIRRSAVVGRSIGKRQIASGEWIVFRDQRADSNYLRQLLVSDWFHPKFMATVSGVGGSLLRARPAEVAKIKIPLPPLPEQRRIAAVLDKADALRAKRREAIAKLDQLLQSVFLDMFGDPVTNPRGWPVAPLSDVVNAGTIVTYGIVQAGEEFEGGVPYIRTGDIKNGELVLESLRRTSPEIAKRFARSRVESGDIVMSIRATVGTTALVPESIDGANLTQGTARIAVGERINRNLALHHLRTPGTQQWIQRQVKGATFREITLARLRELPMMIPPREQQERFSAVCARVDQQRHRHRLSSGGVESLFAGLQSESFS